MIGKAGQEVNSRIYKPLHKRKYDLWSDRTCDDFDYQLELKQEIEDLGYNPRDLKPVGKEKGSIRLGTEHFGVSIIKNSKKE